MKELKPHHYALGVGLACLFLSSFTVAFRMWAALSIPTIPTVVTIHTPLTENTTTEFEPITNPNNTTIAETHVLHSYRITRPMLSLPPGRRASSWVVQATLPPAIPYLTLRPKLPLWRPIVPPPPPSTPPSWPYPYPTLLTLPPGRLPTPTTPTPPRRVGAAAIGVSVGAVLSVVIGIAFTCRRRRYMVWSITSGRTQDGRGARRAFEADFDRTCIAWVE